MKKILGVPFLVIILILSMVIIPVSAASVFSDVPSSAWYANDVASVQQYGIINGTGNGKFSPNGNLTLAEAITMAARTHAHINCESIPTATDSTWYAPYLRYANEKSICSMGEFGANYNGNCNRLTMAKLFERVVPKGTDIIINNVSSLPDVQTNDSNLPVFHLYQLGILTGSDKYGTFNPYQSITRAETAAILHRVLEPAARKSFVLEKIPDIESLYDEAINDAYYEFYYNDEFTAGYITSEMFDGGDLVYYLYDIDGNGIDEVLVAFEYYPEEIYAIYTIHNYQVVRLGKGYITPRGSQYYTLCQDGRIAMWSWFFNYDVMELYQFPKNGAELKLTDSFVCLFEGDGDPEFSYWYSNKRSFDTFDFDTHAGYQAISPEYFDYVVDFYASNSIS